MKQLQNLGIITPVSFSEWAAPIVPIMKNDSNIRICGDYKVIINQTSQTDSNPLPCVDDHYVALSGGTIFSKLNRSLYPSNSKVKTIKETPESTNITELKSF